MYSLEYTECVSFKPRFIAINNALDMWCDVFWAYLIAIINIKDETSREVNKTLYGY